jgi:hypothetical protein
MTDIDAALEFIFQRIEEEAARSGEPLSEEEHQLLHELPSRSVRKFRDTPQMYGDWGLEIQIPTRDIAYERLCKLAKSAYDLDRNTGAAFATNWEFAASVTKLNHHPAAWLLDWAGVKYRKPWWDHLVLLGLACLVIAAGGGLMLLFELQLLTKLIWAIAAALCVILLAILFRATGRIEDWELRQSIESSRRNGTLTSGLDS